MPRLHRPPPHRSRHHPPPATTLPPPPQTQAAAVAYLKQSGGKLEPIAQGKAVLGYVVLGPVGLLLIAELARVSATLPGGHEIKTVSQSRWHRIQLQVRGRVGVGGRRG